MGALRKLGLAIGLIAGLSATVIVSNIAHAQALNAAQTANVEATVQAAIAAVNMGTFPTQEARDGAMANALATVAVSLIGTYGTALAQQIAMLVIGVAENANIAGSVIGLGLGQAATQIVGTDPIAAAQIANAIGAGGNLPTMEGFNHTVIAAGRNELALAANAPPPPCDNPSCS